MPSAKTDLYLAPRHLALLCELLAAHVPRAEVWAYGSRVTGGAHEGSDLDLVLRNPENLAEPVEGRWELIDALQESLLPMLVEVHDWAHLPESFRAEIQRGYVALRADTPLRARA